eukprot:743301-Pelagomonas_calceolata.AAC.1
MEPAQQGFHVYEEEEGRGEAIPLDGLPLYGDVFLPMASVGKPRSYMIQSSLSWSVVLKAE